MGLFDNILKPFRAPTTHTASRVQWENIIRLLVLDFEEGRRAWFAACRVLLKDEKGMLSNPHFGGEAEVATIVIQCADALELIASKQYISPENGKGFATHLFSAITNGKDLQLAQELYRCHLNAKDNANEAGEIMHLCQKIGECLLDDVSVAANMTIAGTLPLFTRINYQTVARAFNDHETLRELEKSS